MMPTGIWYRIPEPVSLQRHAFGGWLNWQLWIVVKVWMEASVLTLRWAADLYLSPKGAFNHPDHMREKCWELMRWECTWLSMQTEFQFFWGRYVVPNIGSPGFKVLNLKNYFKSRNSWTAAQTESALNFRLEQHVAAETERRQTIQNPHWW